jgi:hypothetical protein
MMAMCDDVHPWEGSFLKQMLARGALRWSDVVLTMSALMGIRG